VILVILYGDLDVIFLFSVNISFEFYRSCIPGCIPDI